MCQIFAGQNPAGFRSVTRSVRLSGHATSIRLEAAFWDILDLIAEDQGLTTPKFLTALHDEAEELHGVVPNFTSMLRTTCLLYLSGARPEAKEITTLRASASVTAM
ncbi:MAG: ribbon-helix-helix domain-containing protein [Alphaproteobacteria bacterium]|nr:ribbon-helix-helix domain-containing protein [Alphaproteobacteria bacterium]